MCPRCGATLGMHPCCIPDVAGVSSPPGKEAEGATSQVTLPSGPALLPWPRPHHDPKKKKTPQSPLLAAALRGRSSCRCCSLGLVPDRCGGCRHARAAPGWKSRRRRHAFAQGIPGCQRESKSRGTQGCTLHVAWNHGKSGETPNPAQEGDVSGSDTVLGPALSPAALGTAPPNRADASSATAAGRHCTASPKPPRAADTVPSPAGLQSSRGSSPSPICSIPQAKGQSSAPQFASAVLSMCRATQKYFHILVQKQLQKL